MHVRKFITRNLGDPEFPCGCQQGYAIDTDGQDLMELRKSDELIVSRKSMNNVRKFTTELTEKRGSTKGNSQQYARFQTQSWEFATSRLLAVQKVAIKDKKERFTSLFHHLDIPLLRHSFWELQRRSAAGCDGVTWKMYSENLFKNLKFLHDRLHNGRYRPNPARRVYIPKEDGATRPLSIICIEDKIVQQAIVTILNNIYETDFLGFSYGFRPGRGQHDALDALHIGIMKRKVNWVLDMDISKFFDCVDHDWLIRFIRHRIADRRVIRLVRQWLKVGFLDEHGHRVPSCQGTPQGAVVSPLLANIYLHYSFDLWFNKVRRGATGEIIGVRYADDVVLGFQKHQDAVLFLKVVTGRLEKFGLKIHPDKTHLIRFGKFAMEQYKENPLRGKAGTFDFLGFTHYLGKTLGGKTIVKRKTKRKRMLLQLKRIKQELRRRLHDKPWETGQWLRRALQGHINYYGVPFNSSSLNKFVYEVKRLWLRQLRRRSQRNKMNWSRFIVLVERWLPKPQICHPYPEQRFYVKHPR